MTFEEVNESDARWLSSGDLTSINCLGDEWNAEITSDRGFKIQVEAEADSEVTVTLKQGANFDLESEEFGSWRVVESKQVSSIEELIETIAELSAELEDNNRIAMGLLGVELTRFSE